MNTPAFIVHCLSGGLDSTVLLYDLIRKGNHVHCVLFDYAQTHKQELTFAKLHCKKTGTLYTTITLPQLPGSAITDGKGSDIVPNRNAILLSIAAAHAAVAKADIVTYACNADDRAEFPDCRPDFVAALNAALKASETPVQICAPFIDLSKRQIVALGKKLKVDLNMTWSCYKGGAEPCGKCLACRKRAEAMK